MEDKRVLHHMPQMNGLSEEELQRIDGCAKWIGEWDGVRCLDAIKEEIRQGTCSEEM